MDCASRGEYAWEYLTVLQGDIELLIDDEVFCIRENHSLYFACDREHTFRNIGVGSAVINMIVTKELH